MKIDDLVEIGRLGNKVTEEGYFKFKRKGIQKKIEFHFLDVFLVFTDYRVRYVTIEDFFIKKGIYIKIRETGLVKDVIRDGKVKVMIAPEEYYEILKDGEIIPFFGFKACYDGKVVGEITDYIEKSYQNLFVLSMNEGGNDVLIPDVDNYVKEIDEKEKAVIFVNIVELLKI